MTPVSNKPIEIAYALLNNFCESEREGGTEGRREGGREGEREGGRERETDRQTERQRRNTLIQDIYIGR